MSDNKMSDELQIAIRRSPEYTAPSAELVALRAEAAAWRRALGWVKTMNHLGIAQSDCWDLRFVDNTKATRVGWVHLAENGTGWIASDLYRSVSRLPDRNTACTKVCELLGLPVVLPVGGE